MIICRVTILKDKQERRSRGVAFILFLEREAAHNCVRAVNNTEVSPLMNYYLY